MTRLDQTINDLIAMRDRNGNPPDRGDLSRNSLDYVGLHWMKMKVVVKDTNNALRRLSASNKRLRAEVKDLSKERMELINEVMERRKHD